MVVKVIVSCDLHKEYRDEKNGEAERGRGDTKHGKKNRVGGNKKRNVAIPEYAD